MLRSNQYWAQETFASTDLSVSIIIWNKCCRAGILGCSAPALFQISCLQINCGVKLCLLVSFATKFVFYAQTNKWKWQRDLRISMVLRTFMTNCKSRNGVVICECLLYHRMVETTTDSTKAQRWKKSISEHNRNIFSNEHLQGLFDISIVTVWPCLDNGSSLYNVSLI